MEREFVERAKALLEDAYEAEQETGATGPQLVSAVLQRLAGYAAILEMEAEGKASNALH